MELAVKTESFKKVVSCASRATSSKSIQPILNNILLSSENGSLVVSATDLDLAIECKLPAETVTSGQITLPAKKLDEIVNKVTGLDIKLTIDKNQLTKITSDRSKFQINGVLPEDFPKVITKSGKEKELEMKQADLLQALSLTSFACSKYDVSSVLSGINFEIRQNEFEVGGTDGSRLARYVGKLKGAKGQKEQAVIPWRASCELERLMSCFTEGNENITISFLPGQVIFQNNDFTLSTRLIDSKFPSYTELIPKGQENKAVFSRISLFSALERVAILANERTNVVKLSFSKKSSTCQITAHSPDYGNAQDEVDVEYEGSDLEIAFNYRFLSEALRSLDTEKVVIELESPLSPLLLKLTEEAGFDYTYLIMPVQLR